MVEDDPESTELPDDDDDDDFWDTFIEEGLGIGQIKRIARAIKKRLSREYRDEIRRLRKKENIMVRSLENQNEHIKNLKEIIAELEARVIELEAKE